MSKLVKKLLAIVVTATVVVGLTACGGGAASSAAESPAASAAESSASSEAPASTAESTSSGEGLKIGACVMDLTSEYFSESVKGYEEWIRQNPENELTVVDGQGKVERQIEALENFIASDVDCILLNSLDPDATESVVKQAIEKGIKVNQYPDADYVTCGLCNDDYNFGHIQGEEAAKWINEKLGGEATVFFIWNPQNAVLTERYYGQRDALLENCDESKLTLLEPQSAETAADASKIAENILTAHPETRVLLSVGDSQASAWAEVLKAKGVDTSEWFLSGVDGSQQALDQIKDGTYGFRCSVGYSLRTPDIAFDLIDNIARAARGEDYAEKYYQDVIAVTAENVDDYLAMEPTYEIRFDDYYSYWKNKVG